MEYQSLLKLSYTDNEAYQETYLSRFSNECAVLLDFDISGNKAFYMINPEILLLITKIMSVDRELTETASELPEPALQYFRTQALIDEIKQTNDIENVYSTKKQIKETVSKISNGENSGRFKGLIHKYIKLQENDTIPLKTCENIRQLYDELVLSEVVEEDKDNIPDGEFFRKGSVSVYNSTGKEIHTGLCPEAKIINAMSSALMILNDDNVNHLISAAIFHYLFAYIHPFYDGNGRTNRFISSYFISKNLNSLVAYKLAYTVKKHKSQYYKMFSETNDPKNKGDLTPFIIQFLEFILEAEKELYEDLEKKSAQFYYGEEKIGNMDISESDKVIAVMLLWVSLFSFEGISAAELSRLFHKSNYAISNAIKKLSELNLLRCVQSGRKKLYELDLNEILK